MKKSVITGNYIFLIISLFFIKSPQNIYSQNQQDYTEFLYPSAAAVRAGISLDMGHEDFIRYALFFSGTEESRIEIYMDKYRNLASGLDRHFAGRPELFRDNYSRGNEILVFLHDNLFRQYNEKITAVNVLFDRGIYNCVSSGILYYALALRSGLDVYGVKTKDHAFCAVLINGRTVDVETTTEYGFDPGEKKEFKSSFGETGFVYTPPSNYRDRTDIDQKDYLALILQNRISEMQRRGNYTDTIQPAVDRYALLGTAEAFIQMITEFKNHAAHLNSRKEYEKGVIFFQNAFNLYNERTADKSQFSETADKLFYNRIVDYLEKNLAGEAQKFYDRYFASPVIGSTVKRETLSLINEKKIYLEIMDSTFPESLVILARGAEQKLIDDKTNSEYLVFIYSREIQRQSVEEGWVKTLDIAGQAMAETKNDSRIKKLYNAVEYNISVQFHNEFVNHYNSGRLDEALKVLNEGLILLPGNKRLTEDMKLYNSRR